MNDFTRETISIIKTIPEGKVITYGLVAELAGAPRAARQVSRILHSLSRKYDLPWHRVINSKGIISLKSIEGKENQKWLLEQEGIKVSDCYEIDLNKYLWNLESTDFENLEKSDI